MTRKQTCGAVMVVIGVLLIVASALVGGRQAVPELTIPELLDLYANLQWIGYVIASVAMLVVLAFAQDKLGVLA